MGEPERGPETERGSPAERGSRTDNVVGRRFPTAEVRTLAGDMLQLPYSLAGAPAVLLVAYQRATQADIERWMPALSERAPGLTVLEVPTIPSPMWRPFASWIDAGMRGGVPSDKWSRVATAYSDGGVIRAFLGESRHPVAHVVLLDADGIVRWYAADGYSDERMESLVAAHARLMP